ncbi:hypothetical protein AMTR_s00077p00192840 [Amborella trichopoda]|uniref:Uncharacterized protein n=1 Tax=Amborella trichopoda TaxID=13333 RepID=W1P8T0_AMBTC|nr:hypothetical protein AMTR_s00077p00192840 [Amborella trichopoda]
MVCPSFESLLSMSSRLPLPFRLALVPSGLVVAHHQTSPHPKEPDQPPPCIPPRMASPPTLALLCLLPCLPPPPAFPLSRGLLLMKPSLTQLNSATTSPSSPQ